MSYTMTIDEPKEAAWFEETSRTMTPAELGALFVVFLRQQIEQSRTVRDAKVVQNPFASFCGMWNDAEFDAFQKATQRTVDPGDWQ